MKRRDGRSLSMIWRFLLYMILGHLPLFTALGQAPVNDHCSSAALIQLGAGNYATGLFSSDTFNIRNATTQSGEQFHASMVTSGNTDKSIWFRFTLPTKRGIKIELKQPGNSIISTDVGFTTYKSGSCFPALSAVSAAYITPLSQFGSSFHPCLEPGEYLIQVSARNRASGIVQIELTSSYPYTHSTVGNALYDLPDSAFQFGVIGKFQRMVDYEVGCHSIEDSSEWCSNIDTAFRRYIQSSWHTFRTGSRVDFLEVILGPAPGFSFPQGTIIGYNLYEGDVRTQNHKTLKRTDSCSRFHFDRLVNTSADPLIKEYICALDPNKTYSIQLLFTDRFASKIRMNIRSVTADSAVRAPVPVRSAMSASNLLGALAVADTAITRRANDFFSCGSRLALSANQCGQVNPGSGIQRGIFKYGLSTWFEFELNEAANVEIFFPYDTLHSPCNRFLTGRIFQDTITNNCNDLDTSRILQWFTDRDPALLPCLQPGKYAVQILGVDVASFQNCDVGRHLGRNISVSFRTIRGRPEHKFSLKNVSAVDSFNASAGKLLPLKLGTTYTSRRDTLGCLRTVLPARGLCGDQVTKGMYRIFSIADADNDSVPDSGMVVISNYAAFPPHNLDYRLYKGNAVSLAQAQSKLSYPDTISGLWPLTDCFSADLTINTKSYCLTPGDYTLVSFGGDANVGAHDAPQISFQKTVTKFRNPHQPERLDTLKGTIASAVDYFSCYSNTAVIDGVSPCNTGSKLIYREFYLAKPTFINIFLTTGQTGTFTLFTGRSSIGLNTLKLYRDESGPWTCFTNRRSTDCNPIPAGWYTLVAYSNGPSYDTTAAQFGTKGNIGAPNSAVFFFLPEPARPQYNRPAKAFNADSAVNLGKPLDYLSNIGTNANPQYKRTFILGREIFDCYPDTPFSQHPITPCDTIYNRFAYYAFSLSKPSHIKISGVAADHRIQVYDFDARKNPALLSSRTPIQTCYRDPRFTELCMLDSGSYTIVILAGNMHLNRNVQPVITVDSVGLSRFDFARNAYNFGEIPGDSIYRKGRSGDVHPLDTSLPPSADVFYCTTGSSENDPFMSCNGTFNPGIYAKTKNNAIWNNDTLTPNVVRRNIWYTFTLKGTGNATVRLNNLSQGLAYISPFAVYASDVSASIPFDSLRKNGGIDSTLSDGLTEVARNFQFSCNNSFTATFKKELCDTFFERRYYVQVGLFAQNLFKTIDPIAQISLEVLYDTIDLPPLRFDHYREASLINGLNQNQAPYTVISPAEGRLYNGFTGTFKGATVSSTDQSPSCAGGNIWYRTTVDTTGKLFINYRINKDTVYGRPQNNQTVITLLRSMVPGDSTNNGLRKISYTDHFDASSNSWWARACVAPGTYYILLSNCGLACSDLITPVIRYDFDPGDQCGTPEDIALNAGSSSTGIITVDCHTIGEGYGEDGSDMGCLFSPNGHKSSWFKVEYNDTNKVDLLFEMKENTTALASQIRYRVLYGQCSYLSVGPCNSSSMTQFELKCMQKGTYFVQVITPEGSTGSIELKITAVIATDTLCVPIDPFKPFANFNFNVRCRDNRTEFTNLSSRGDSIVYRWNFGHNGATDTAFHTSYMYPMLSAPATYPVRLIVLNLAKNTSDTFTRNVTVFHQPNPWLPADTSVCPGNAVRVSGKPFGVPRIQWFDLDTSEVRFFNAPGIYTVAALVDTCRFYDSIRITHYIAPTLNLGPDREICQGDSTLITAPDTFRSYAWNTASSDSFILVKTQGLYRLIVVDHNGCSTSDSLHVAVNALPDAAMRNAGPFCVSDQAATIQARTNSGGIFSGGPFISSSGSFDPAIAGVGWHSIYYQFTDAKTCTNRDSLRIRVNGLPHAGIVQASPLCIDATPIHLQAAVNPGGTFSGGSYVQSSGRFDPAIAGAGIHKIFYQFTDTNGCSNSDSTVVRVNALPDAGINSAGPFCIDAGIQRLSARTNSGGTFGGGAYINNSGNFNPMTAGSGLHRITYVFTDTNGCTNHDSTFVRVNALPDARIRAVTPVCVDTDSLSLQALTHSGGTFYGGTFIDSTGTFRPDLSGDGTFKVYYRYTDLNSCTNTDSTLVTIHPLPDASIQPQGPFCIDFGDVYVLPQLNYGGTFSSTQNNIIDSAGLFRIATAGSGTHQVYYTYRDANGCVNMDSTDIKINPLPDASIVAAGPWCIDAGVQRILPASNTGGRFRGGSFVQFNGDFNPAQAGAGLHKVFYEFTDSNLCFNRDSISVRVHPLPNAALIAPGAFCIDHDTVRVRAQVNNGGIYSGGPYISSAGVLYPSLAGAGIHRVYYRFTDANGCINHDSTTVRIHPLPNASITASGPFCADAGVQQVTPAQNPGGIFSGGTYITSSGRFDPFLSGIGIHKVRYAFTDSNGCFNRDSMNITVNALPDPSIQPAGPFCVSAGIVQINPRRNTGGTFSGGAWISADGKLDTRLAGVGLHRIRYEITDANGCFAWDTISVRIHTLPDARIKAAGPFCLDDPTFVVQALSNAGGVFSAGPFIQSGGQFSPSVAGAGLHRIYYDFTDLNGCSNRDSSEIRVHPLPDPSFTSDKREGCTVLPVTFFGPPGMTRYIWEFSNGVQSNSEQPRVLMPTGTWSAHLKITDINGCKNELQKTNFVTVHPLPVSAFDFNPKQIYIRNPKVDFSNLSSGGIQSWLWDMGDGAVYQISEPTHEYLDTGRYLVRLEVIDTNGCTDISDNVIDIQGEYFISIPNAFTPGNSDGLNDRFRARGYGISSIHYSIYNRWGELLYEKDVTDVLNDGWDGLYLGKEVPFGAYLYQVKVEDLYGEKHYYSGTLQLLR